MRPRSQGGPAVPDPSDHVGDNARFRPALPGTVPRSNEPCLWTRSHSSCTNAASLRDTVQGQTLNLAVLRGEAEKRDRLAHVVAAGGERELRAVFRETWP